MYKCLSIILSLFITSCAASKMERMNKYEEKYKEKNCSDLTQEIEFQEKVKAGLVERNKNKITAADVGATVLTLGINVIDNSVHKNSRNNRIGEVDGKIEMLNLIKEQKECKK